MTTVTKNSHLSWWFAATCFMLAGPWAHAERRLYNLDIPDGQAVRFEVPIELEYAGELAVHAEWDGNRTLAFRIEPANRDGAVARRSGPPPIHLKAEVTEEHLSQGAWTLVIHALPLRGASQGRLTIDLPEPPKPQPPSRPASGLYARATPETPEPWQAPRGTSAGWTGPQATLVRTTESFRKFLVENQRRPPDTCRWQDDLLRWLATQRDSILDDGAEPDVATGKLVTSMAEAIRSVERMRVSRDPLIVGPAPADGERRAGWERLREDKLRVLKGSLDELMSAVQRNHAPELENERWPVRLVSCLTASERYFDQRWIVAEDRAPHRDLAEAQWTLIQRAADALEALAEFAEDDVVRLKSPNK